LTVSLFCFFQLKRLEAELEELLSKNEQVEAEYEEVYFDIFMGIETSFAKFFLHKSSQSGRCDYRSFSFFLTLKPLLYCKVLSVDSQKIMIAFLALLCMINFYVTDLQ